MIKNNVLVLEIDNKGLLVKRFCDINDMNEFIIFWELKTSTVQRYLFMIF